MRRYEYKKVLSLNATMNSSEKSSIKVLDLIVRKVARKSKDIGSQKEDRESVRGKETGEQSTR